MTTLPFHTVLVPALLCSPRPDTPEQVTGLLAQNAAVIEGRFSELVERTFPALVDPAHNQDADLMDFWCQTASEVGGDAFVRQNLAALKRADGRTLLPSITVPSAVIHGRGDRLIPPKHGEDLAARIPGALLTLIDDAGHLVVHEQPVAVAAARIAILHEGRILVDGTLDELKALLPPATVEHVEKQPTLEDVFLAVVGHHAE